MIEEIRIKVSAEQFEYSRHALDQCVNRDISVQELREAVNNGEVIERYPGDKYGPSCLIFGWTLAHRPLHVHCSYPSRDLIKIITICEPDPERWVDYKERRRKN